LVELLGRDRARDGDADHERSSVVRPARTEGAGACDFPGIFHHEPFADRVLDDLDLGAETDLGVIPGDEGARIDRRGGFRRAGVGRGSG
jgi:hypothetical protein